MLLKMSLVSPRPTASGLMIASVRSTAIRVSPFLSPPGVESMPLLFSFLGLFLCLRPRRLLRRLGRFRLRGRFSKHAQDRLADCRGALDRADNRMAPPSVLGSRC